MKFSRFLDLPDSSPEEADVILLPLPYEGTVSYGGGTAGGPAAIWRASRHIELLDEQTGFELDALTYHSAAAVEPIRDEEPASCLLRVRDAARRLYRPDALLLGVGGEHSLTPALVEASCGDDLAGLTVVQIDAHRDLRESYEESPYSHACAMRRLVERGAALIAIGIRSGAREEVAYANQHKRIRTFTAFDLVENPETESALVRLLGTLSGDVYLTIDVDGLEVHHCFGTGTPEPGGLSWWQTMRYLRTLLAGCGSTLRLVGADVVETVPVPGSQVNEYTAARLLAKIICFHGPAAL